MQSSCFLFVIASHKIKCLFSHSKLFPKTVSKHRVTKKSVKTTHGRERKTALSGVTTYVMAGISKPFDQLPYLNFKVSFFPCKAITIYLPQNKNVSVVPDDISGWNI